MEDLLADALPFLSPHLNVKDLFRVGAVCKHLRETVQSGNELFQHSIRAQVGLDEDHPQVIPVYSLPEDCPEEENAKSAYYPRFNEHNERWVQYPQRVAFHTKCF